MAELLRSDELTIDHFCLGIIGLTYAEAEAIHAQSIRTAPLDMACQHRGERIESIECATCQDKRTILFVFSCDLHGKCLLGTMRNGVRGCDGCKDLPAAKAANSVTIP
jgi:hypothetical protein